MRVFAATAGCALAIGLAIGSLTPTPAHASLIGDTVTAQLSGFFDEGPQSRVVSAGLEFSFFAVDIDLDAFTALFRSNVTGTVGAAGQTVSLTSLDLGTPITGLDLLGSSLSVAPLLTFTGNSATLMLPSGTDIAFGDEVKIEFLIATPIPLPAALPLMLGGLGMLGLVGLRRRRHPAA